MSEEDEGFLKRWSRRKIEAKEEPEVPPPAKLEDKTKEKAKLPLDLPSIDSLTKESDFKVFLQPGVPEELHRAALRKLWKLDPDLSRHDGMTDYAEDYGAMMREGEKFAETAYKIGRGFLEKGDLPWDEEEEKAKSKAEGKAASVAEVPAETPKPDENPEKS
ncbi:MAG: DUF3306 domain-containing protein [Alphaproteobacteria bacterium]|nr:DUF3306 domain-containing protein [Alphaproteobacteria bacterium]